MSKNLNLWLTAIRPKTLTAAVSPVLLGLSLAYYAGFFEPFIASLTLLAAILIQAGTNLANDVFDFEKGADTEERLGPLRVTQAGLLTPKQVKTGMYITFGVALIIGFYLAWVGGVPIVIIGSAAILSGIAYTGGPYPLGYNGLGDIFVFLFFGLVAVPGTFYLQGGDLFNSNAILLGVCMGLMADGILIVNNVRDLITDEKSGKRTLAVRYGKVFSCVQFTLFMLLPFAAPFFLYHCVEPKLSWFLCLFGLPIAVSTVISMWTKSDNQLNLTLIQTARIQFLYTVLLSIGFIL